MIRKQIFLFFICILVVITQAQDILVFNETTGLPTCAYDCKSLYSAQYECQGASDTLNCFCGTKYVAPKPKSWRCDEACATEADKERIRNFLATTCGDQKDQKDQDQDDDGFESSEDTASTDADTDTKSDRDPQTKTAMNWWHKNWPYFFLAFMLVATCILAMAFAGPIRKYYRRQIIGRRARKSGQGVPPYWAPSAPAYNASSAYPHHYSGELSSPHGYSYASGGIGSPSPQREGGYLSSGGLGSYSEVGTPSDPGPQNPSPTLTPLPLGIRTLFASQAGATTSTRQESWERRIREQHEGHRSWGEKLAFWKSASPVADKRYSAVNPNIGRAV